MLRSFRELKEIIFDKKKTVFTNEIGKKALSLIELKKMHIPVPDGFVVLDRTLKEFLIKNGIDFMIDKLISHVDFSEKEEKKLLEDIQLQIRNGQLPDKLTIQIDEKIVSHKDINYAVRSSGNKEDLSGASFAGLYSSFLNVKGAKSLEIAVKDCWASLFNYRVLKYCKDTAI